MPTRLIHESLCTSRSISQCSPKAQDAFVRFLLYADNFGCFEIDPVVIKGRIWPMRRDISPAHLMAFLKEYEAAGMLQIWQQDGRTFGYFLNWVKFQRRWDGAKRKTPTPPKPATTRSESQQPAASRGDLPSVSVSDSVAVAVRDSVAVTDIKGQEKAPQPHQTIVNRFLELQGTPIAKLSKEQVSGAYRRHSRSAIALIREAGGLEYATAALEWGSAYFDRKNLTWTLDTIAKHLPTFARCGRDDRLADKYGLTREQAAYGRRLADWLERKTQPVNGGVGAHAAQNGVPEPGDRAALRP